MMDAEERHRRRLMLMRAERAMSSEHRNRVRWLFVVALAVLALIFMSV